MSSTESLDPRSFSHWSRPQVGALLLVLVAMGCDVRGTEGGPVERIQAAATTTITISGRVTGANGGGVLGVTIAMTGSSQGTKTTDANGAYSFTQLPAGSFSLSPSRSGCSFTPSIANLNSLTANTTQNFVGAGTSCVGNVGSGGAGGQGGSGGQGGNGGQAAGAKIGQFALLSSGTITLGDRDQATSGDVGTSLATGSPFTLVVGQNDIIPGNLFGVSIQLRDRASVGNVSTNQLTAPLATFRSRSAYLAPPAVPAASAFSPGAETITVPSGASRTLAAGSYGSVAVFGTLQLSGGSYQFASLTLGPTATVSPPPIMTVTAPAIVHVAGAVAVSDRATVGVSAGLASTSFRLIVGAQGANAASFGNDVHLNAMVLAPRGTVIARDRLILGGAIAAAAISVGNDAQISLAGPSGFGCSADAECNDSNVCTQDVCSDGFCAHNSVADATACDDGNACTQTDSCRGGTCTGANPVVCAASDQCHVVGTCNPATGQCSNPAANNGTGCDDGNACTRTDSCQSGTCTGTNPVVCSASDQCHVAGTCSSITGTCSNPNAPDGTTCSIGTCSSGSCNAVNQLTILDSSNNVLFTDNVPTNNTFAYAASSGALGSSVGAGRNVRFTPGAFPPGQEVIVYDFPYGLTSGDEGGSDAVSDVLSGGWICLPTAFKSLAAPAGQTVTVTDAYVLHVVRYVHGTCRVHVPLVPVFHEAEQQVVSLMEKTINDTLQGLGLGFIRPLLSVNSFQFLQPQFRSSGSDLRMGFLYEAMFKGNLGPISGTLSVDPAFNLGLRQSDGLFTVANIDRNVTTIGIGEGSIKSNLDQAIQKTPLIEAAINSTLSPPISQLLSAIGLSGTVNTSCVTPTPAAPSPECFNNVNAAITSALGSIGTPPQLVTLATQILQPINFTCDNTNQCRFHPVFQGVNILPDSVEIVLAPDLRNATNPINGPLTSFFSLVGPQSLSQTVTLGGTPVTVTLDCSVPPVSTKSGNIATVFNGSTDLAAGIACGGISQP